MSDRTVEPCGCTKMFFGEPEPDCSVCHGTGKIAIRTMPVPDIERVRDRSHAILVVLQGVPVEEACMACLDAFTSILVATGKTTVEALDALRDTIRVVRASEENERRLAIEKRTRTQ